MKNKNTIDGKTIEEIVRSKQSEDVTISYEYEVEGSQKSIPIVIRKRISVSDKENIVTAVVNGCFDGASYEPFMKKELFRISVLQCFTNITTEVSSDALFDLAANTDLFDVVALKIPCIEELEEMIDDMIEYRKQEILCAQKQALEDAMLALNKATEAFVEIGEKFKDVDPKQLMNIIEGFSNKQESQIVDAILDRKETGASFPDAESVELHEETVYIGEIPDESE